MAWVAHFCAFLGVVVRVLCAKLWVVTAKEQLHDLVDELSEPEAKRALRLVKKEHEDPLLRAIANAPEDDEPWTDEDEAAMAEVRADDAAGVPTIPLEQVMRELGDTDTDPGAPLSRPPQTPAQRTRSTTPT